MKVFKLLNTLFVLFLASFPARWVRFAPIRLVRVSTAVVMLPILAGGAAIVALHVLVVLPPVWLVIPVIIVSLFVVIVTWFVVLLSIAVLTAAFALFHFTVIVTSIVEPTASVPIVATVLVLGLLFNGAS